MLNIFYVQDELEQVILVGGATRVPKVQEALLKAVRKYVLNVKGFRMISE